MRVSSFLTSVTSSTIMPNIISLRISTMFETRFIRKRPTVISCEKLIRLHTQARTQKLFDFFIIHLNAFCILLLVLLPNICHRQTNTQFATVITRLQESPICQRLPFMSFMLLPFQRITRIKMLIEVSE